MTYACDIEMFLGDVSKHQMTIIRADGVFRHIRFRRPDESSYRFDLITWPGTLCIDGDMGTYVFRRTVDMLEFFRTDNEYAKTKGAEFGINPSYWGEKLRSIDTNGGFKEFDPNLFREAVKWQFDTWVEEEDPSDEAKTEVWSGIEREVLEVVEDGGFEYAMQFAMEFRNEKHDFEFVDFLDYNFKSFTFSYIWCCYAIAWGVKTFDELGEA